MYMKNKYLLIGIAVFLGGSMLANAQSGNVEILGNLSIKDNPDTGTELAPVTEGNLRVAGSLLLSGDTTGNSYATGKNSIAIGNGGRAIGDGSIALSMSESAYWAAHAYGAYSIAIGPRTNAGNTGENIDFNIAYGYGVSANGGGSIAIGTWANANGINSIAIGNQATAKPYAFAIGYSAQAGTHSVAIGGHARANGGTASAYGYANEASDIDSAAFGAYSKSNGRRAYTLGYNLVNNIYGQTVIGMCNEYNEISSPSSTSWRVADPLFVIGNGQNVDKRSNALVMLKNGDTEFAGNVKVKSLVVSEASGGIPMGSFGRPPAQ